MTETLENLMPLFRGNITQILKKGYAATFFVFWKSFSMPQGLKRKRSQNGAEFKSSPDHDDD